MKKHLRIKKILPAVLATVIAICLAGCSLFSGNKMTEITLPATIMDSSGMRVNSDLTWYISENRFETAEWNDDGSLTITMTNKRATEMKEVLEEGLVNSFAAIRASRDTYFIRSIETSKDYRTVTITADKEAYLTSFELTSYTVGMSIVFFQAYTGEEPSVDVIVLDTDTGLQIERLHYPLEN